MNSVLNVHLDQQSPTVSGRNTWARWEDTCSKGRRTEKSCFYYSGIAGEFICLLVSGIQAFQLALIDHNHGS